jgi:hypothetical protein
MADHRYLACALLCACSSAAPQSDLADELRGRRRDLAMGAVDLGAAPDLAPSGAADLATPSSTADLATATSPDLPAAPPDLATPSGAGVLAVPADTFLSSLGVNTHIDQGYSASNYVAPLIYTGIRNIRDGERNLSSTLMLHQQTGIKVDVGAGCDVSGLLAAAQTLAQSGALLSVEGPNEPNNFPITYNGQTGGGQGSWIPVAECQHAIYAGVKASATLKAYPVFSVSEDGAEPNNVGLQFLTIPSGAGTLMPDGTQYGDYANPHNYVCSTQNVYEDNMAWNAADPTLNGIWDGLYVEYGHTWYGAGFAGYSNAELLTLPRVTTETGWDSVSNPGGETVQGKVLVNTYLAQFKRGWRYTFIYELVDGEGSTGNQGLYRADYSAKPVATYLHNLTTVLADTAAIASPGRLDYAIASPPATVHDLLLQKSSGAFELVIWGERASGTNAVTVSLGATRGTVNVYDVTAGATPVQTLANVSAVPLTVADHALIVEIVK